MAVSSRRKIFGGDGYRELEAKERIAKIKRSSNPLRNIKKDKLLKKLMVTDRKRRKLSERAAKLVVPRSSGSKN